MNSKNEDEKINKAAEETLQAPADALSRTPDDLASDTTIKKPKSETEGKTTKKQSKLKQFLKRINVYLLMFILVVIIAIAITTVYYLNSQKEPVRPVVNSQELSEEALKQLANKDTSVGDSSQTLTIQGSAIIDGQTLMRNDLNVAGNIQAGGSLKAPTLTISGAVNLGETQTNSLQVAQNMAVQGNTTLRNLSVSGTADFSGAMKASQITASRLILSGNASLEVPNHLSFTGPSPSRSSINSVPLGSGGSASITGSDTTGTINVNTGNNPGTGCFIKITFNQSFTKQPRVIISPVGSGASKTAYFVDRDQSGFSLCTSSPAPANQSFAFDYFVTG